MEKEARIQQDGQHPSVMGKMGLLFFVHDLLPWEDSQQGLTCTEIRRILSIRGLVVNARGMDRLLTDMMNLAFVDYEGERPRRFRRMYRHRLTDAMPGGVPLPNGLVLQAPDWRSEIVLSCRRAIRIEVDTHTHKTLKSPGDQQAGSSLICSEQDSPGCSVESVDWFVESRDPSRLAD